MTTLETTTGELSAGLEGMNQEMEAVKQTLIINYSKVCYKADGLPGFFRA